MTSNRFFFLPRDEKNCVEALAAGAAMSIALVANIAVMLIAFLSVLAFLDAILCWLGSMVGVCWSFEVSYSLGVNVPFLWAIHTNLPKS